MDRSDAIVGQEFTSYERDTETNLDFAQARYYANTQGRFTSVDPLMASAELVNPQSFNRYSYGLNSPANNTDPSGMISMNNTSAMGQFARNFASGYWSGDSAEPLGGVDYARSPSELMPPPPAAGGAVALALAGAAAGLSNVPQNPTKSLYQTCRESAFGAGDDFMGKHLPDEAMSYLLLAAGGTVNDSAFAASIVAKESDFRWRPTDDHGPAQLTIWWKKNQPQVVVGEAYDPFLRGTPNARAREFTGSPENNIMTLGNIVRFQRKHHAGNEYMMAKTYYSGPGDQDAFSVGPALDYILRNSTSGENPQSAM